MTTKKGFLKKDRKAMWKETFPFLKENHLLFSDPDSRVFRIFREHHEPHWPSNYFVEETSVVKRIIQLRTKNFSSRKRGSNLLGVEMKVKNEKSGKTQKFRTPAIVQLSTFFPLLTSEGKKKLLVEKPSISYIESDKIGEHPVVLKMCKLL